ncbi:MAG: NAD(P)/FAD-dependent oxidoreductase [Paludibacter sp.]|nr:NAD(P)/FAD-dependent oxidoreductase [Bacteroidales bacterium]MCM1068950.1 NAD(P)/FAD-dependent oxidoreductase [Prevotella sp.]MCM1353613.1 NAD(P)/FAD-dependent oxidoreductase [Bacteroides sp.]MCM1442038.1 NAD(P)/FAD-dependent oxidoreductase [Muribaculum sp.]MCM1481506.1 NAD(P)/FAD-dependent oxidoreductase [Paludibacter sp.]
MKKVIIIGGGLGGLECGYILAKKGLQVTILEHDTHIGGCLQSFRRGETLFDTGFHYVGGLAEGQSLHGLFRYFGLLDLPWQRLDDRCFDEVVIGNKAFPFAQGHERFVERLTEHFPHQHKELQTYTAFLRQVGEHLPDSFLPRDANEFYASSLFAQSAWQFLNDTITDPLLRKVLSGTSLKMELNADTLPLYVFAQINNSFIESAWRLKGGGQLIADCLQEGIQNMGGTVLTKATVTRLIEQKGAITAVEVNGEEIMEADWVISNAHPAATLALVDECAALRRVYRKRIDRLENTFGMFTANIRLKKGVLPYENKNIYVHREDADLWKVNTDRVESVLLNYYVPTDETDFTPAVDMLTPLRWQQVSQWANKPRGHRGDDYVAFKAQKTEECLQLVEKRIPELRGAIDRIYTSSPLSYHYYTLTQQGTAYGIRKDYNSPITTVLTPRTPLQNLLLTGQSLNLHGVLGVSMTSVFTCAEILGMTTLVDELDVRHWRN